MSTFLRVQDKSEENRQDGSLRFQPSRAMGTFLRAQDKPEEKQKGWKPSSQAELNQTRTPKTTQVTANSRRMTVHADQLWMAQAVAAWPRICIEATIAVQSLDGASHGSLTADWHAKYIQVWMRRP